MLLRILVWNHRARKYNLKHESRESVVNLLRSCKFPGDVQITRGRIEALNAGRDYMGIYLSAGARFTVMETPAAAQKSQEGGAA